MSSILDALKKLETDKAEAEEPDYPSGFGAEEAERELVAQSSGEAARSAIPVTPLTMLVGGGVFVVLLVAISVAVASYYMLRSTPVVPLERTAQASPTTASAGEPDVPLPAQGVEGSERTVKVPAENPPEEAVVNSESDQGAVSPPASAVTSAPSEPEPEVKPAPVVAAVETPPAPQANSALPDAPDTPGVPETPYASATSEIPKEPEPAAKPEPSEEDARRVANVNSLLTPSSPGEREVEPARNPIPKEAERRVEVASLKEPAASAPPNPGTGMDLSLLPVLTNSQRDTLGIPELTINFVGMPTKRQPRPSALINLKKVYVGERIPGTKATLIGVEMHGIGIEANGQQFFVPN